MPKKDNQLIHFLTVGIIKLLLVYSKTALLLFVLPFWLFFFSQLGIVIGLAFSSGAFSTLLYCISCICFFLMVGSLWLGFRTAQGICRIIALIQMGIGTTFCLVASYRNIFGPGGPPFEPDSIEAVIGVCTMFCLFVITIFVDVARAVTESQSLE